MWPHIFFNKFAKLTSDRLLAQERDEKGNGEETKERKGSEERKGKEQDCFFPISMHG